MSTETTLAPSSAATAPKPVWRLNAGPSRRPLRPGMEIRIGDEEFSVLSTNQGGVTIKSKKGGKWQQISTEAEVHIRCTGERCQDPGIEPAGTLSVPAAPGPAPVSAPSPVEEDQVKYPGPWSAVQVKVNSYYLWRIERQTGPDARLEYEYLLGPDRKPWEHASREIAEKRAERLNKMRDEEERAKEEPQDVETPGSRSAEEAMRSLITGPLIALDTSRLVTHGSVGDSDDEVEQIMDRLFDYVQTETPTPQSLESEAERIRSEPYFRAFAPGEYLTEPEEEEQVADETSIERDDTSTSSPGLDPEPDRRLYTLTEMEALTGLAYVTLTRYVQENLARIPHEGTGRARRYPVEAVQVFHQIRDERAESKKGPRTPKPESPKPLPPARHIEEERSRKKTASKKGKGPRKSPVRRPVSPASLSSTAPSLSAHSPATVRAMDAAVVALERAQDVAQLELLEKIMGPLIEERDRLRKSLGIEEIA